MPYPNSHETKDVPTQIKNQELVNQRRRQIADAAVRLFIEKGFHKTTTREIAGAAGISTGLLYEYVRTKEDVLYLVCDAIHSEVEQGVTNALRKASRGRDVLAAIIKEYFIVCHRMSDHILLIYQETRTLPPHWRTRVLEKEIKVTQLFVDVVQRLVDTGDLPVLDKATVDLIAHNITVLGHMWTFRRWFLSRNYTIDEYIEIQTRFILGKATCFGMDPNNRKIKSKKYKEKE
ncbi:MAG: TetR/AcrR family transcriptional regulator [Candidatus Aminicenantes bacterium]|nr:TetR/AcrR family transcriptional regulator [Candidatus Aminicenantes bacterium]